MVGTIGKEALIPNPALRVLDLLAGEWITTGTHPYFPGTTFHGRTCLHWVEGGAFFMMRSEIDEPGIPSAVAIFGSDDGAQTLCMLYFDERGISRKFDVTTTGNELTWLRQDPRFSQRRTLAIEADGQSILSKGQMSRDGSDWEEDLELAYVRTSP